MPDMNLEWSPPPSLIENISSGKEVLAAVEETKSTYAHFLTQTGVPPAQANEVADALIGRIITALARGDSPEDAVAWAKQGVGAGIDPLAGSEAAPPLQTLAEALSQGRGDAADIIAKAVATAGSSPEAQKVAVGTLLTSLANGNELAVAQQQAIAAGQTTDSLKASNAVPLNATDTLISSLAQGGPGIGDALHGLAAEAGTEQSTALAQNLFAALSNGTSSEAAVHAWQEQASAQAQTAQAQTVPVSSIDAMIAALSSGADAHEALMTAGFGGNSAASQALAQALAGGANSGAAAAAAEQASQAQATAEALTTAGVAAPSALLAGLASGGADAGSAIAAASQGSDGSAFINALTQALSTGAPTEAAIQAANTASSAAATQAAEASSPPSAETALAAALASGADVQSALASVGISGEGSQSEVMASALTQALSSGQNLASAVGSATTAGAASDQQAAAAQDGVPAPDPQLMAMSSGSEQGSSSASPSETTPSGNSDSAPATGQPEATAPAATSTDPSAQVAEVATSSDHTTASDSPSANGQTEASSTASSFASSNAPADAPPSPTAAATAPSTASSEANTVSTNSFDVASEPQTITAPFAPENHNTSTGEPQTTQPETQTTQSASEPTPSPETSTTPAETPSSPSSTDTSTAPVDTGSSSPTTNTPSSSDTSGGSSGGSSGPVTNPDIIDMTHAFSAAAFAGAAANNLSGNNPTALEFDLSSPPSFSNGMTVEAWINQARTVPGPIAVVVDDQSTDTSGNPLSGFKIEITHSNNIEIEIANGIVDGHYTDTEVTTTDTPIVNGTWENIAATYSNTGAVSISVNGVIDTNVITGTYQDSPVPASGAITNAPSSVIIGTERDPNSDSNWSAARDFAGMISDVQIWNSSSQNIQTDMSHQLSTAASAAASESNLVLAAPLNSSTFTGITQGGTSNVTVADLTQDNDGVTNALQSGASVPTIASTATVPSTEPTTSTSASVYQALVLGTSSTNSAISINQPTYSTTYTPHSDPSTPTTVTGTTDTVTNAVYQTPALPTAAQASTSVTVTTTVTATDTTGASDEATQVVHATAT